MTTQLPLPRPLLLLLTDGETPIDHQGGWVIAESPVPEGGWPPPWIKLRLTHRELTFDSSFHLGVTPGMGRGVDWIALESRHPDVAAWVEQVATNHARMIADTAGAATCYP